MFKRANPRKSSGFFHPSQILALDPLTVKQVDPKLILKNLDKNDGWDMTTKTPGII